MSWSDKILPNYPEETISSGIERAAFKIGVSPPSGGNRLVPDAGPSCPSGDAHLLRLIFLRPPSGMSGDGGGLSK